MRIVSAAFAVVLVAALLPDTTSAQPALVSAAPSIPVLTAAQWREDLATMAEQMERRHKNLYHTVSRAKFAAAVAELDARIPSLQRNEIVVGMMRIAASVGDAHTNITPLKDAKVGFRSLPLKLYWFDDGLTVRAATPEHASLVGATVEAIGGIPVEDAIRRATDISPADNAITPRLFVPVFLGMPGILHALKLASHPDSATLTLRKGDRRWTTTLAASVIEPVWPPDTDISLVTPPGYLDARGADTLPLWLQAPLTYHRMIELPAKRALYVQLSMVTDIRDQTLAQFARRIAERVKAVNPASVVLDVRLNRGGNGDLRFDLVREMIRLEDDDTRLAVLTARGSFSATQFILDDLERYTDAVFIGEPAGSKANHYGDSYRIVLPHSGITVRTSIRWHQVGNDQRPWTPIDVATRYTYADYVAGRDPALATALDYVPRPTLEASLIDAARDSGVAGALSVAKAFHADPMIGTTTSSACSCWPVSACSMTSIRTRDWRCSRWERDGTRGVWTCIPFSRNFLRRRDVETRRARRR